MSPENWLWVFFCPEKVVMEKMENEKSMKPQRVVAFIDGFNFYHSLANDVGLRKFKWTDLWKLITCFTGKHETLTDVYYFTALCSWDKPKKAKHQHYIQAVKSQGVKVVLGRFKQKQTWCRNCKTCFKTHEEKRTDVNIAIYLLKLAYEGCYDTALLMSGDTDLIPAIQAVKERFPEKKIGVIFPMGRVNDDLKKAADFSKNVNRDVLEVSRLPNQVPLSDGTILACPPEWM
jgi:uncharacterized LabA/DUF88 family protein